MLPSHAPPDFQNRSVLWNLVEKIEKSKNSQLAREIDLAIPKELNREQQISLVREYVNDNFVSVGMCADIANKYLEKNAIDEHIDHRSFERQGTEQIPTIHLGVASSQMERKGITTERGNINREIKAQNKILAEIKAKINCLTILDSQFSTPKARQTNTKTQY